MAGSSKYRKIKISNIGDDEPIFFLRALDKLTAMAIDMYRSLVVSHGVLDAVKNNHIVLKSFFKEDRVF